MEPGIIVIIVAMFVMGIVAGISFERIRNGRSETQGIIHADYSDPEDGPYLFLEPKIPIVDIVSRKRVVLDVDITQYFSHE